MPVTQEAWGSLAGDRTASRDPTDANVHACRRPRRKEVHSFRRDIWPYGQGHHTRCHSERALGARGQCNMHHGITCTPIHPQVPDKNGEIVDVVLGFDAPSGRSTGLTQHEQATHTRPLQLRGKRTFGAARPSRGGGQPQAEFHVIAPRGMPARPGPQLTTGFPSPPGEYGSTPQSRAESVPRPGSWI
jgi:hypothetical protein